MTHTPSDIAQWTHAAFMPDYGLHYNISPGSPIVVIHEATPGEEAERCRIGTLMRWGFIPSWAKDPAALPMLHNARSETAADKPMFRRAFQRRRCLIPASGFYEWKAVPGQKPKQPFYISMKDGSPMTFAGLWERARDAEGEILNTCTILTTEANATLAPIHPRMPLLLDREGWDEWLSTETEPGLVLSALARRVHADQVQVWGVSHAVNKVSNDKPALLLPIA